MSSCGRVDLEPGDVEIAVFRVRSDILLSGNHIRFEKKKKIGNDVRWPSDETWNRKVVARVGMHKVISGLFERSVNLPLMPHTPFWLHTCTSRRFLHAFPPIENADSSPFAVMQRLSWMIAKRATRKVLFQILSFKEFTTKRIVRTLLQIQVSTSAALTTYVRGRMHQMNSS